jgi:ATP-dependent Clp protease ATP-binding subunit ClpB
MSRKVISVIPKSAKLSRISFGLRHGPAVLALAGHVQPYSSSRRLPVIPGYYVRSYASQPPGGAGGGGGGGFPGFMQQQHQKGDALKEYVSLLPYRYHVLSLTCTLEC